MATGETHIIPDQHKTYRNLQICSGTTYKYRDKKNDIEKVVSELDEFRGGLLV